MAISPADGAKGAVIASPSRENPNYYYHWVRDAALTMDTVLGIYRKAVDPAERAMYREALFDYIEFSERNQRSPAITGLGEPKFLVDGRPYDGPWGRPQIDSPALRAVTMIHIAETLLEEGEAAFVHQHLYDGSNPGTSVIKLDLEYLARNWKQTSFDLWEEVRGHHFFTRMLIRRAMLEGARLADQLGDPGSAASYRSIAAQVETEISKHWDPKTGILQQTLGRDDGIDYKTSGLDTGTLLAVLHGDLGDGFFGATSDAVISTLDQLERRFQDQYEINRRGYPGVAIGRYPEDRFYGGNPWVLATAGYAEWYYVLSNRLQGQGKLVLTEHNIPFFRRLLGADHRLGELFAGRTLHEIELSRICELLHRRGDEFLERVKIHKNADGSLSEQIRRDNGYMESAVDLTWNYARLISTLWARQKNLQDTGF